MFGSKREAVPIQRQIEGYVDRYEQGRIAGWAFDPGDPTRRVLIEVSAGGSVALILADRDRPDLRAAGKGDGRYGFDTKVDLKAAAGIPVTVRDTVTGQHLAGSPYPTDIASQIANPDNHGQLAILGAEARVLLQRLRSPAP